MIGNPLDLRDAEFCHDRITDGVTNCDELQRR